MTIILQDKTKLHNSITIDLTSLGTVTADDGTTSVNGSWSMLTDVNRNDVLRINISEAHLQGLNEQWTVNVISDELLIMKGAYSEMRLKKM